VKLRPLGLTDPLFFILGFGGREHGGTLTGVFVTLEESLIVHCVALRRLSALAILNPSYSTVNAS
jgi:hypothetical protein